MTERTRYFLRNLREYLDMQGPKSRQKLGRLHAKMTGAQLSKFKLSKHLACKQTPNMDSALVYIRFAIEEKISSQRGNSIRLLTVQTLDD